MGWCYYSADFHLVVHFQYKFGGPSSETHSSVIYRVKKIVNYVSCYEPVGGPPTWAALYIFCCKLQFTTVDDVLFKLDMTCTWFLLLRSCWKRPNQTLFSDTFFKSNHLLSEANTLLKKTKRLWRLRIIKFTFHFLSFHPHLLE